MDSKLLNYLQKHKIQYNLFKHPAVFTVEESKKIKKIPGMHCKALFLKDNKNIFYLVAMKADKRLDTKMLRKHLKIKKLNFASPEELNEKLKVKSGSVSIFNLVNAKDEITLRYDEDVWKAPYTGFHPNINTETLILDGKNLQNYCNSLRTNLEILSL